MPRINIRPPQPWWALVLLLLPVIAVGQGFDYGNAWYSPNRTYARLKVAEDGIYRLTADQLVQSGFDTSQIDYSHYHLLYRGVEVPVYVDPWYVGRWNYIEFFGRRNDGGLDSLMYMTTTNSVYDGSVMPNPLRSAFSDTSVYYLYADSQPGLRLQPPFLGTMPPPLEREEFLRTAEFPIDPSATGYRCGCTDPAVSSPVLNPNWTTGEGFGMLPVDAAAGLRLPIHTPHGTGAVPGTLHLRLLWTAGGQGVYVNVRVDGQIVQTIQRTGYFAEDFDIALPPVTLDSTVVEVSYSANTSIVGEPLRVGRAAVTYEASAIMDGGGVASFPRSNLVDEYYKFVQLAPAPHGVAHDLVHQVRVQDTMHHDSLGIWVAGQAQPSIIVVASEAGILTPTIAPVPPAHHLGATSNAANLVLITSRALTSSANAYRNYRQASTVNPLVVKLVYTDEIYEEFGHGVPHPMAIKRFCKYAVDSWAVAPDHILLWGDGHVASAGSGANHVPVYGEPASDLLYVSGFRRDTLDFQPIAAIGRVPIPTNIEGTRYLSKVQTYETGPEQGWMRSGLFSTEASDTMSSAALASMMQVAADTFAGAPLYGRVYRKDYLGAVQTHGDTTATTDLYDRGLAIAHMLGVNLSSHQLPHVDSIANDGRYPLLVGESCTFAPVDDSLPSRAEEWLLASNRGAIASIGYSVIAYSGPSYTWSRGFDHYLYHSIGQASMGQVLQSSVDSLLRALPLSSGSWQVLDLVFLGDPSVSFRTSSFSVWPGDANDDMVAEAQDLLAIGLSYGQTGPTRPNASNNWTRQPASPWDTASTGYVDMAHADCDGNGVVNSADTLAIVQNYGFAHNKAVGLTTGTMDDPELLIESSANELTTGAQVDLYVRLGTALHTADSVYGIAWSLYYDPLLVDSASVEVRFDSCWLGTVGMDILTLSRQVHSEGRIDMAITRTDHTPISGEGIISRVGIVVIDNISGKLPGDSVTLPLPLTPAQVTMIDPRGAPLPVQGIERTLTVKGTVPLPTNLAGRAFAIFPNPTADHIYLYTAKAEACTARVTDLQGRVMLEQEFPITEHKRMDLSALAPGTYLLQLETPSGNHHAHVVRMR